MKKRILYCIILAGVLATANTSCINDLDTLPLDKNVLVGEQVFRQPEGYVGLIAKCYASLILAGQMGPAGDGDIKGDGLDEGYSAYTRSLLYLQSVAADEVSFGSGSSAGVREMLYMDWNSSTPVIKYVYYRLYMTINYTNEFLRRSTDDNLKANGVYDALKDEIPYYRAEARFIRAYCYSMICDLFGAAPFVDETMGVGTTPNQKTRKEIYDYAASETEDVSKLLKKAGTNQYGRIDEVAAWFLMARIYINAESWGQLPQFDKALTYAKRIVESNAYPLASDYRHIFLADNNTCKEIIWPLVQDGLNTQSYVGTNFFLKALGGGDTQALLGMKDAWGNGTMKYSLVDKFHLTDQVFDATDPWGDNKMDKRAQFYTISHTKETWEEGKGYTGSYFAGYATLKFRNRTKDRMPLEEGGSLYSSINYPLFRTADAYLMAAEAILRGGGGTRSEALAYVNEIRNRAYLSGNYGSSVISGEISDTELTLDFILEERARELHLEFVRRTDLIRFGKYTKGYNWDWKGTPRNTEHEGRDVDDKYKLFPIPTEEFTVNPYLTQNPDYR